MPKEKEVEEIGVKKINMTSKKKEMLEAYNQALKLLRKKKEEEMNPVEKREEKKDKEILEIADALSYNDVIKKMGELKIEIGGFLEKVSDKLSGEVNAYANIKKACQMKEKELREIYEIEKNSQSLAALIESHNAEKEEFDRWMNETRSCFDVEMNQTREKWEKEKQARESRDREEKEEQERRRKRENEEYKYSMNRQMQMEKDKFEDEKAKLSKELREMEEEAKRELAQRESAISAREEEFKSLRRAVDNFPKDLEAALNKANKDVAEKFKAEKKRDEDMLKQIFEGEKGVLNANIEALTRTVEEQNKQILRLSQQLDGAYQKIQNIAIKTVGGIGQERETAAVGAEAKK